MLWAGRFGWAAPESYISQARRICSRVSWLQSGVMVAPVRESLGWRFSLFGNSTRRLSTGGSLAGSLAFYFRPAGCRGYSIWHVVVSATSVGKCNSG